MTRESHAEDSTALAPDAAFKLLGNETRMDILQTLGEADGPLSFTELRDRVGIRQGAQFNYHLDKLVDHFVARTDDGYELRQSGRRVVLAVLSGAVTDDPEIAPTRIDQPCTYCGAPIEVNYSQEMLETYCTECPGAYRWKTRESVVEAKEGHLGGAQLPPAGVPGRTAAEAFTAALTWGHLRLFALAAGVCPACGAAVDREAVVCEDHDATTGICSTCEQRFAVQFRGTCTNCIVEGQGIFVNGLVAETEVLAFLATHDVNLIRPTSNPWARFDFEEEVVATDPLEVQFTLAIGDDRLTLTVDDGFDVVDVARG